MRRRQLALGGVAAFFIFGLCVAQAAPPTITTIDSQFTVKDTAAIQVAFDVGDAETDPANLVVSATSGNTIVIPSGNLTPGGAGTNRSLDILPAAGQSGQVVITVTVTDADTETASRTFSVDVKNGTLIPAVVNGESWTPGGSPYIALGAVDIQDVQIAAGTIIEVAGVHQLTVSGSISATGTSTNPIIFRKCAGSVGWAGVKIEGASSVTFDGCVIRDSIDRGLRVISVSPTTFNDCAIIENFLGVVIDSSEVTMNRCQVSNNTPAARAAVSTVSSDFGVGIRTSGKLTLNDCSVIGNNGDRGVFQNNPAEGGGIHSSVELICNRTTIATNAMTVNGGGFGTHCWGGGIFSSGLLTLTDCVLEGNLAVTNGLGQGGGIYCSGVTMTRCIMKRNRAFSSQNRTVDGAGIFMLTGTATITNSLFVGGISGGPHPRGGGIFGGSGASVVENCHFVDNHPNGVENFNGTVRNSIFTNSLSEIVNSGTVDYCMVKGGHASGTNIIDHDAITDFVDPTEAGGDYRLVAGALAIDAGDPDPAYNDGRFPPSQGTSRNDLGAFGGPNVLVSRAVSFDPTVVGSRGSTVTVPILLESKGNENAASFTIEFDPSHLSNPQVALGADMSAGTLATNTDGVILGRVGVLLSQTFGTSLAAGVRELVTVTFDIASDAPLVGTSLAFGDDSLTRSVITALAEPVDVLWNGSTLLIANTPPIAVDDAYAATEEQVLSTVAPGLLGNDSDPDNGIIQVVGSETVSALGAVISVAADGAFTYDPTASEAIRALGPNDADLTDAFTYQIADDSGGIANATVQITVSGTTTWEGDVSPSGDGNNVLEITDWQRVANLVIGTEQTGSPEEFQRADTAPRADAGDGQINVADWVQTGLYVVGTHPPVSPAGPSFEIAAQRVHQQVSTGGNLRALAVSEPKLSMSTEGATGSLRRVLSVKLESDGSVTALGFSLAFDPSALRYVSSELGAGAGNGGTLLTNQNGVSHGQLGVLLSPGLQSSIEAGTAEVLRVEFEVVSGTLVESTEVSFSNSPARLGMADAGASPIEGAYANPVTVHVVPDVEIMSVSIDDNELSVSVEADPETIIVLEASRDLLHWTDEFTGEIVDGVLTISVGLEPSVGGWFFRARSSAEE